MEEWYPFLFHQKLMNLPFTATVKEFKQCKSGRTADGRFIEVIELKAIDDDDREFRCFVFGKQAEYLLDKLYDGQMIEIMRWQSAYVPGYDPVITAALIRIVKRC